WRSVMRDYLRLIATETPGPRCDVTPLFADHQAFLALLDDLDAQIGDLDCDLVAGIDALGFILGTALTLRRRRGFLAVRKAGKLPVATDTQTFTDYSGQAKALELPKGALSAGARVLVVDEWIETGAQVWAACTLIERQGGTVAGVATINLDDNARTAAL